MAACLFFALAFKKHQRDLNQSPLRQQLGKDFLIQPDFTARSFTIRADKGKNNKNKQHKSQSKT